MTPQESALPIADLGAPCAHSATIEVSLVDREAPTLVAFGGMAHQLMMPTAEFSRVLSPFSVNLIFVKDFDQAWYQRGLRGVAASIEESASIIMELVPGESAHLGVLGTSAGGTGALLFGSRMGAQRIVAFSPTTEITAEHIQRRRDAGHGVPDIDSTQPTCDARSYVMDHPGPQIDIHFGSGNSRDVGQAMRMQDVAGVVLHKHDTSLHACARWLKEQGRLAEVLQEAFSLRAVRQTPRRTSGRIRRRAR